VPEAIINYWQYWEAIRLYGPKECIKTTQQFVQLIDGILLKQPTNLNQVALLKKTFGFSGLTTDENFAAIVTTEGIGRWQGRNWDPEVSSTAFAEYCGNITSNEILYEPSAKQRRRVEYLIESGTPFATEKEILVNRTLNWIGYLFESFTQECDILTDACFTPKEQSFYEQSDLDSWTWRSWTWQ
jgi:hypothetical protein